MNRPALLAIEQRLSPFDGYSVALMRRGRVACWLAGRALRVALLPGKALIALGMALHLTLITLMGIDLAELGVRAVVLALGAPSTERVVRVLRMRELTEQVTPLLAEQREAIARRDLEACEAVTARIDPIGTELAALLAAERSHT